MDTRTHLIGVLNNTMVSCPITPNKTTPFLFLFLLFPFLHMFHSHKAKLSLLLQLFRFGELHLDHTRRESYIFSIIVSKESILKCLVWIFLCKLHIQTVIQSNLRLIYWFFFFFLQKLKEPSSPPSKSSHWTMADPTSSNPHDKDHPSLDSCVSHSYYYSGFLYLFFCVLKCISYALEELFVLS